MKRFIAIFAAAIFLLPMAPTPSKIDWHRDDSFLSQVFDTGSQAVDLLAFDREAKADTGVAAAGAASYGYCTLSSAIVPCVRTKGSNNYSVLPLVGYANNWLAPQSEVFGNAFHAIINTGDSGLGTYYGQTFSAAQMGMSNTTSSAIGAVPANAKQSMFGFNASGAVGSLNNTWPNSPVFRNLLDDGAGNGLVSGVLTLGTSIGAAPKAVLATTAAYVRKYGAGYTSVLACFDAFTDGSGPARITDYFAKSQLYTYNGAGASGSDGYIFQQCLNNLGDRQSVIWPAGAILETNLTVPSGQNWIGVAGSNNTGTVLFALVNSTVPMVTEQGTNLVDGFSYIGNGNAAGQYCNYVHNASHVRLRHSFFQNCYAQIYEDGGSYYLDVSENLFYSGSLFHIFSPADTSSHPYPQGVDLIVRANRFLSSTTVQSAVSLSNLGSLIWDANIISVETPSGPLFNLASIAPNYGGTQISNSVFESNNTSQPVLSLTGANGSATYTDANNVSHTYNQSITLFRSANNTYTGSGGAAVDIVNAIKPAFANDAFTSSNGGADLHFGQYATASDVILSNIDFETSGTPIKSDGNNAVGLSIYGPAWGGPNPLVDFTAVPSGGNPTVVTRLENFGGNVGSATNPFLLPASASNYYLAYRGSITMSGSLTMGGALALGGVLNDNMPPSAGAQLVPAPITLAAGQAYALGMGSGFIFVGDNNGAGGAIFYANGGGITVMGANNSSGFTANSTSTSTSSGGKIGVGFVNGRYTLTNNDTAAHTISVWTMQLRAAQ